MPKVSVIVPVYNAEKTITACLSSLVNQTLSDMEIILVNDCSTDRSYDILSDCEKQYSEKIILVNSDINRGPGGARNIGLSYASGDYIGFMDSDDYAATDMYEKLYNTAVLGNYDIVDCGYYNEAEDNAIIHTTDELSGTLNDYKRSELIASGGYLWSKIFKKSLFSGLDIVFREKCILEDCETLMKLFAGARSIGNVKEILYCYKNNTSSSSKCINAESYYNNCINAVNAIYNTLSVLSDYDGIKAAVEYSVTNICVLCLKVCLVQGAAAAPAIKNHRLSTINNCLKTMITIPYDKNKFTTAKINKDDLKLIKELSDTF